MGSGPRGSSLLVDLSILSSGLAQVHTLMLHYINLANYLADIVTNPPRILHIVGHNTTGSFHNNFLLRLAYHMGTMYPVPKLNMFGEHIHMDQFSFSEWTWKPSLVPRFSF